MNKHVYIFIAIISIIVVMAGLYIFLKPNPAKKTVDQFLEASFHKNDKLLLEYLSPSLRDHPFIDLLYENYFKSFKIIKIEEKDAGLSKVWVSFSLEDGTVSVPFTVERIQNKYFIVSLPRTNTILAAIPLEMTRKDSKLSAYKLDINGTYLNCFSISPSIQIEIGVPASFLLIEDYIINYSPMIATHLNKILVVSQRYIEDSLKGMIPIIPEIAVYEKKGDSIVYLQDYSIPVGIQNIVVFRPVHGGQENRIALIDRQNIPNDTIRVVLNNDGYKELTHDEILLTCEQNFSVKNIIDSKEYKFEKGAKVSFYQNGNESILYHEGVELHSSPHRWYVRPEDDGKMIVINIHRAHIRNDSGTPYRGILEIVPSENGLILVNEVPLEQYLYSVVPSEMPVRFGLEALKVQAIAARSYALRCLETKGFSEFGAHVDDSTASQVYNNVEEHPIAIQAVQETHGLVPFAGDEIVDTRFFSTSCGYTANAHEVWSTENQFPGKEIPYLCAKPQFPGDAPSLYNEENFRAFIDQREINGYDKYSPYFRWSVEFTREQLEAVINKNLSELQKAQSSFILTKGTDGSFIPNEIPEDVGELQNIEVIRRGEGGNIMELEITTTRGTFKIIKELNIRRLLQPINLIPGKEPIKIKRYDGTVINDFSILPSAFAYFDIYRDNTGQIVTVAVSGGGYGHGVGMSQYGCYGLTLSGKSYKDIIEHYYPGTELRSIY